MKKHISGFTLLEVLLSISIVGILTGIMSPVVYQLKKENDLNVAAESSLTLLRRAYFLARASTNNESWGVYSQTGSVTLFQGATYATRDTSYDEIFSIAGHISLTGVTEEVFSKFSGAPSVAGDLRFSSDNNSLRAIRITSDGSSYEL